MAVKKVYYYKVDINNLGNIIHNGYNDLFSDIINNVEEINGLRTVILDDGERTNGSVVDRITMDIINNDENYLFARVCKSKDNTETLIRNIETNEIEEVVNPQEMAYKSLEIYTYCLLDYYKGILSYIEGRSAPSVSCFKKIIDNYYNDTYNMIINNIASTDTVRALLTPGSVLNKINYEFRVPTPEILHGLDIPTEVIDALNDSDVTIAKLTLKNSPRKPLSYSQEVISKIVKVLKKIKNDDNKISLTGRTPNSSQQDYSYELKNYSSPIDVPATRIEDGEIVPLTIKELSEEFYTRMLAAYTGCIDIIMNLANVIE